MKCPYLSNNSLGIQNPQTAYQLENMERDECSKDECKEFESCWNEKKPINDLIEEVFEGNKDG